MKLKKTFYLTTAIDYVNARPHVGHAFEKTVADAIARWKKLKGYDVFFLTGVDENAQKNVEAAKKAGISTKEFIDQNAGFFLELCNKLNLSYNEFIRTTAKEHALIVQSLINKIVNKGDIYKSEYSGLYCVGCETYYTEKDLNNGKCPEHGTIPELRKEEAYFFKLNKYESQLLKIIPKYVVPKSRANEILRRIKEDGLNDVCISRKGAKWGIDFPNDKDYKIWVWIDALINYVSGLKDQERKFWPANLHIVGKGINWFHSVIWPAILISAKYKLPKKLLVHGYLNLGGQKISKSSGNVVDPIELLNKYSADSVRYSLLKCSVFEDSDYSEEMLITRNNNELADKLGNLVSRVSALAEKYGVEDGKRKILPLDNKWKKLIEEGKIKNIAEILTNDFNKIYTITKKDEKGSEGLLLDKYFSPRNNLEIVQLLVKRQLENYELDKALNTIFAFIDICNEYVQSKKPWETKDKKVLYELADSIKAIAILLWPFVPETSEKIAKNFGFEIKLDNIEKPLKVGKIKKAEILFWKIVNK